MKTKSKAFDQAVAEGLSYFWARMHVGHVIAFVGQTWEDGGFTTNDDTEPTSDPNGNTVAKFTCEVLDPSDADHVKQVEEWYG
jgi:hypothetical protein